MRYWYDEEHDMKMCEPDCVDEWLFDIWAIGHDYDGCHNTKDLKALIDELVGMAGKARECLWERRLFGSHGEPKPQTNEEVVREWIPVTERLPDETRDEYVLVVCDYYGKIKVETRKMWHIDACVTHWMPLPEPPMRKGENG